MLLWNLFLLFSINALLTQKIFLVYRLQLRVISGVIFSFKKKIQSEEVVNLSYCLCAGLRFHPTCFQKENSKRMQTAVTYRVKGLVSCQFLMECFSSGTAVLYVLLIYLYLTPAISPLLLPATEPFAKERQGNEGCYY